MWFFYHSRNLQNHQKPHIFGVARFATGSKTSQMNQSDEFDEKLRKLSDFWFQTVSGKRFRWFRYTKFDCTSSFVMKIVFEHVWNVLYRVQNNHKFITTGIITQNHNQVWSHLQSVMNVFFFSRTFFSRSSELNLYFVTLKRNPDNPPAAGSQPQSALELAYNSTHKRARAPEPVSGM